MLTLTVFTKCFINKRKVSGSIQPDEVAAHTHPFGPSLMK